MRVSIDWLRDWVQIDGTPEEIAGRLTTAGLEVDAVLEAAPAFDGVVVGRVSGVEAHPGADALTVCTVEDGSGIRRVVCGAPNVTVGVRVPFALPGATLPGGRRIAATEVRGASSEGMLCSAAELGLGEDTGGLWLLGADAPVGMPLREYLRLDDAILDIDLTPNRGDCFSVLGIARELGALTGSPLAGPAIVDVRAAHKERIQVRLEAAAACPRFAGRVIRNVPTGQATPLWMQERLRRAGLRPIYPIVDVTNYVMLELGQPLHAYDLSKLQPHITARFARGGERLTMLDGQTLGLDPEVLVIADRSGPVGVAGIMGGAGTAVAATTRDVFLEAAFFAPSAIAGRARRFGLHTDASVRFERGVDPCGQVRAIERATQLLMEVAGGEPGPTVLDEEKKQVPQPPSIRLRHRRLETLLGIELSERQVETPLERLGMSLAKEPHGWAVTPPAFRFDLTLEEDLIEEVGRMVGYDNVPAAPGPGAGHPGKSTEKRMGEEQIADTLVARGYTEVITYGFVDETLEHAVNPGAESVRLANPISQEMAVMRRSLWPGLLLIAQRNLSRQQDRLRLFEIGQQFTAGPAGAVLEDAVLAGLAAGGRWPEHWEGDRGDVDFYDVKGDLEALLALRGDQDAPVFRPAEHPALHPGQTARVVLGGETAGWLGGLHPVLQRKLELRPKTVLFALKLDPVFAANVPTFTAYSKFPQIRRDLALVIDERVSAERLVQEVRTAAGDTLQRVVVFDVYRGTGIDSRRKSVALGLILQGTSRTLTDLDADQTVQSVTRHLERELGATIRT